MTYQVLARKWRPRDFASVVGQQPIVRALQNAISEGRIAHAYLFSGIRGVGKTSVARVLARALNCHRGIGGCTEEPFCASCDEITRGASVLDVIEVDAATYSKVEQVRELTENLKYAPARDRYKVVILDEVHRLSRQAFDALLKIVEEPPSHLVFVFATTEVEAVPATILSRCQEFRFRRVSLPELAAHLRRIADAEGIRATDNALRLIARSAEGSVRDAVAVLDQLATYGSGEVPEDEVGRLLGGLDHALLRRLLAAILDGQGGEVSRVVATIEEEGWDPRRVFADFLAYSRQALHLALGGEAAEAELPREEAASLAELARSAGYENLLRLLHQLLASETTVRRSETGVLAVEIAWLRAAELPKLVRIEEILAGAPPAPPRRAEAPREGPPPSRRSPAAPADSPAAPTDSPAEPAAEEAQPTHPVAAPPSESSIPSRAGGANVDGFLEMVSRRKQPLAVRLAGAGDLSFADGVLQIRPVAGDTTLSAALDRPTNRRLLDELAREVWGPSARWRLAEPTGAEAGLQAATGGQADPALRDPLVQTVLEIFDGTVTAIERRGE